MKMLLMLYLKEKVDDQITQTIEAVMADIAGQYKKLVDLCRH